MKQKFGMYGYDPGYISISSICIGIAMLVQLVLTGGAIAETLTVDDSGDAGYPTIQTASNASKNGDIFQVAAWNGTAKTQSIGDINITQVGHYQTSMSHGVDVDGNYAFVADYENGLVIIDVTNPAAPTLKGSYNTIGQSKGVAVAENYAYVADGYNGLVIVDITNPAAPTLKGSYDTAGESYGVAVAGNYAYVADGGNGLVIVDVTNPAAPTLKGSYITPCWSKGVEVAGNFAYVADWECGLIIVDVTNPAAPTLKGRYNTAGWSYGVAVAGNFAYLADYDYGLVIVDVTNPAAPTLKGSYDTDGISMGVAVAGDYAYVADFGDGLVIVDVTNPAAPILEGSYNTDSVSVGVAVAGNYAYVADGYNGLVILRIDDIELPPIDIIPPTLSITYPVNGTTVTTSTITVSGTAYDESGIANVTVNGAKANGTLNWSANVTLNEGLNNINVITSDLPGNIATRTIFVTLTSVPEVLFYEDWESGLINASKWNKFGSPQPEVLSGGHNNSTYAVDPQGDSWCGSSVVSTQTFRLSDGLKLEFYAKGQTTGQVHHMSLDVGITSDRSTDAYCKDDSARYSYIAFIRLVPPSDIISGIHFYGPSDSAMIPYPDDDWHQYTIEILTDGRIRFYVDDSLKYTTTTPINFSRYDNQMFQIDGRSLYGTMLVDDIMISGLNGSVLDTIPPNLSITYPVNGTTVTNPSITISGTAYDESGIANVTVNGAIATGTSNWGANVTLNQGLNNITVIASDSSGNTAYETLFVILNIPPAIEIFTDKGNYTTGNTMKVGLNLTNSGNAQNVDIQIWIDLPEGGKKMVTSYASVLLPAGLNYKKYPWMFITLSNIQAGNYAWHAVLKNSKDEIISESVAPWTFTGTGIGVESFETVLNNVVIDIGER